MKLIEIIRLTKSMEKRMDSMNIGIESYLGIVIGFHTFEVSEIHPDNINLFEDIEIFKPDQKLVEKSENLFFEYKILDGKIRSEERRVGFKNKRKINRINMMKNRRLKFHNRLIKSLTRGKFKEPRFELRFKELDMEAIQEIKKHPVVQEIGKTDMSRASIRVVIG